LNDKRKLEFLVAFHRAKEGIVLPPPHGLNSSHVSIMYTGFEYLKDGQSKNVPKQWAIIFTFGGETRNKQDVLNEKALSIIFIQDCSNSK
jgi:hypothetical protein